VDDLASRRSTTVHALFTNLVAADQVAGGVYVERLA
jgi:hypothetical protein